MERWGLDRRRLCRRLRRDHRGGSLGGSGGLYLTNNQSEPVLLSAAADTLPLTASIGDLGPTFYQVWVVDSLVHFDTVFITVEEPAPLELIVGK